MSTHHPSTTTSTPVTTAPAPAAAPRATSWRDVPAMAGPPDVVLPSPPAGYVPVTGADLRGYRPLQSELATVGDAVAEIQSVPSWTDIFGITAPPPGEIAPRLQVASDWTALLAASNAWTAYVKSQEGMAWKDALLSMESLKVPFDLASAASPAVLNRYPALARMLGAQKVVAKRAAQTRARSAKATAATNATAVATAATAQKVRAATDAAVAATTAAAATAPRAPTRNVTVTG